jgi:hypothetical protein
MAWTIKTIITLLVARVGEAARISLSHMIALLIINSKSRSYKKKNSRKLKRIKRIFRILLTTKRKNWAMVKFCFSLSCQVGFYSRDMERKIQNSETTQL